MNVSRRGFLASAAKFNVYPVNGGQPYTVVYSQDMRVPFTAREVERVELEHVNDAIPYLFTAFFPKTNSGQRVGVITA